MVTNKTPTGTYRGPGRFECTFVRERLLDIAAGQLGVDPVELRRRNFIAPSEMPYDVGGASLSQRTIYDCGDYRSALDQALDAVGYAALRAEQAAARRDGRYLGIGIGCVLEKAGLGPWEYARVEVDATGHVVVYSGVAAVGQGIDDDPGPGRGRRARASPRRGSPSSTATARRCRSGSAASPAAAPRWPCRRRSRPPARCARRSSTWPPRCWRRTPSDLVVEGGAVHVRGLPDRRLTFRELARAAVPGPPGMEPGLYAAHFFEAPKMTYPYGTHIAVVEVDVETGVVALRKYVITYDVGRAVNPMIVDGQLVGALGQGIGGALLEELVYDEQGQLLTTTLMDYLLPTAMEMPASTIARILEETPTPLNPLGVKGVGEGGSSGCGAAIANAVADALAPLGVAITALPLTPDRLTALVRAARARRASSRAGV